MASPNIGVTAPTGTMYDRLIARATDKRRQALGAGIAAFQAQHGVQPIRPWWEGQKLDPIKVAEARNKLVAALAKLDEDAAKADEGRRGVEDKIAEAQKVHLDGILKYVTQLLEQGLTQKGHVAAAKVAAEANLAGTAGELVKANDYTAPPSGAGQAIVNDILNRYQDLKAGGLPALDAYAQETMLRELTAQIESAGMRPEEKVRVLRALDTEMARSGVDVASQGFVSTFTQPSPAAAEAAIYGTTPTSSGAGLKVADAITAAHQSFNAPLVAGTQTIALADTASDRLLKSAARIDRAGFGEDGMRYAQFVLALSGVLDPGRPLTSAEYSQRLGAAISKLAPDMAARVAPGRVPGAEDVEATAARAGLLTPKMLEQRRALILKAWDDLDKPDVLDPEESRVQIMASPEFRAWMSRNGISDPDYAFKIAQRLAQTQRREIVANDAAAAGSAAPSRLALLGSPIPQPAALDASSASGGAGSGDRLDPAAIPADARARANRENRTDRGIPGGQPGVSSAQSLPGSPAGVGAVGAARPAGSLADEAGVREEIAGLGAIARQKLGHWLPTST